MTDRTFLAGRRLRAALLPLWVAFSAVATPATAQNLLYVACQEDASVAVIDMTTNTLAATVDLRQLGFSATAKPHHTAVEPDGSFWYVSLIGENRVLKFDRSNRLLAQAEFETPGLLGLDPTSDLLYVGRSMAAVNPPKRVGAIQRSTMSIEEVDVFFPRPHALVVDPEGARFFTSSMGQNTVAYAPLGAEDVDLLDLGHEAHDMLVQFAVSPDGHWMVGGGQMSGDLMVFDLADEAPVLVRTVQVGGQPWHPTFTPDGATVWIPNQTANTVTVVDTGNWAIADVITHPALIEPHGSAVSPDGSTIYVSARNMAGTYHAADGSERRPGTVVAIDVATHRILSVIEVGRYAAGMSAPTAATRR